MMSNDVHMTVWRKNLRGEFVEHTVHLEEAAQGEVCIAINQGGSNSDEDIHARVFEIGELIMKAWHFVADNRKLGYGDNRLVETGRTYKAKGEISLCLNGMHGCIRIIDALKYAHGNIVCRVDITGDVIVGDDKIVGRNRKVLWMMNIENILHEFACRCADDALQLVENPDPRSIAAIQAKRDWLAGKISNNELAAARDAAWEAARDAAWEAASAVAMAAAMAAVRDTSRDADKAAAWDAAWVTARDAARDKQNKRLTAMICAARKERK